MPRKTKAQLAREQEEAQLEAAIAARLKVIHEAESSLLGFTKYYRPEWTLPAFHLRMIDVLDKLAKRQLFGPDGQPIYRVMFNAPPRHSKSTYSTVLFPSWYMGCDPRRFVMSASYNNPMAKTFGRSVKTIVSDPKFSDVFPDLKIPHWNSAVDEWGTTAHGKYFGVGLQGTTTGRPATLLLVDDPIKTREEAESAVKRQKVIDFYEDSLITRLEPEADGSPPIEIVTLTRWHPGDLSGHIMDSEDWKEGKWLHVCFQAISMQPSGTPVHRTMLPVKHPEHWKHDQDEHALATYSTKEYEKRAFYDEPVETALWPERFPLDVLKAKQRRNPRGFEALYQQSPYLKGGAMFKTSDWRFFTQKQLPEAMAAVRIYADTAFKKDQRNDPSVVMAWGLDTEGNYYALDFIKRKCTFPELRNLLSTFWAKWRGRAQVFKIEDRASGQSVIQALNVDLGIPASPYTPPGQNLDKVAKANLILPLLEVGRVYLPSDQPWADEVITECEQFPDGTHDDIPDVITMALDDLSKLGLAHTGAPIDLATSVRNRLSLNNQGRQSSIMAGSHPSLDLNNARKASINGLLAPTKQWKGWGL